MLDGSLPILEHLMLILVSKTFIGIREKFRLPVILYLEFDKGYVCLFLTSTAIIRLFHAVS